MKQLLIIPILFILLFCVSCRTVERIDKEVPMVETRTHYVDKLVYDSIYMKDSVLIYISGDTIFKYKEKVKTNYIYKTDTVIHTDSIPYPVRITETIVEEVNVLKWWQKILMWMGSLSIVLLIVKSKNLIKRLWKLML